VETSVKSADKRCRSIARSWKEISLKCMTCENWLVIFWLY